MTLESILLEGRGVFFFFINCLIIHTQPSIGNEYKKVEWVNVERVNRLYFFFLESRTNIKKKQFGGYGKLIYGY